MRSIRIEIQLLFVVLVHSSAIWANAQEPPMNDDFENAIDLLVGETYTYSIEGATRQIGEPGYDSDQRSGPPGSIWYRFIAPMTGIADIPRVSGSNSWVEEGFAINVYTGDSLNELVRQKVATTACNFNRIDGFWNGEGRLYFDVTEGESYYISVINQEEDPYLREISVNIYEDNINDNFMNAERVTGSSVRTSGCVRKATAEPGEPAHAGYGLANSVWWKWIAPRNDEVTIRVNSNVFGFGQNDTVLAVYTGSRLDNLIEVASVDDYVENCDFGPDIEGNCPVYGEPDGFVTFDAVGGQTYWIAVDAKDSIPGSVSLLIHMKTPASVEALYASSNSNGNSWWWNTWLEFFWKNSSDDTIAWHPEYGWLYIAAEGNVPSNSWFYLFDHAAWYWFSDQLGYGIAYGIPENSFVWWDAETGSWYPF